MCVSSTKFLSQIDEVVFSKVSDMMLPLAGLRSKLSQHIKGHCCHGTISPLFPLALLKVMLHGSNRNTACEFQCLIPLDSKPGSAGKKQYLCKHSGDAWVLLCSSGTCSETPAMHTIGSERCQLWKMLTWGQAVLEALRGPSSCSLAHGTASSSLGKQQHPADCTPALDRKTLLLQTMPQMGWLMQQCSVMHGPMGEWYAHQHSRMLLYFSFTMFGALGMLLPREAM